LQKRYQSVPMMWNGDISLIFSEREMIGLTSENRWN